MNKHTLAQKQSASQAKSRAQVENKTALTFALYATYVTLVYTRPFEYASIGPAIQSVPFLPIILGLSLLSWILAKPRLIDTPTIPIVVAFSVWLPITTAMSGWIGGSIKTFLDFLPNAAVFVIGATTLASPQRLQKMYAIIAICTTIIATHGILQLETGVGWSGATLIAERITYVGFLNDPNDLALALLVALPMTLQFSTREHSFPIRAASTIASLTILYAVYLTNSRGAMLAIVTMTALFSIIRYGSRKSLIILPIITSALIAIAPNRINSINASEDSASGRIEAWYDGFQMLKANPVFGVGKGQFVEHHHRTAHNSFILALAELGVPGYALWFSLLALSAKTLYQLTRSDRDPKFQDSGPTRIAQLETRKSALVLAYSLTAFSTAAFFLSRTYVITFYILISFISALEIYHRRNFTPHPAPTVASQFKWLTTVTAISIVALWTTTTALLKIN